MLKLQTFLSSAASQRPVAMSQSSKANPFSPDSTAEGTLPPFEVAKAWAFEQVLKHMEQHFGKSSWMLIGEDKTTFMAKHLQLKGGGHPGRTAIFNAIAKCKQPGWYPGKVDGKRAGRKPLFTDHQKSEMARVAIPQSSPG